MRIKLKCGILTERGLVVNGREHGPDGWVTKHKRAGGLVRIDPKLKELSPSEQAAVLSWLGSASGRRTHASTERRKALRAAFKRASYLVSIQKNSPDELRAKVQSSISAPAGTSYDRQFAMYTDKHFAEVKAIVGDTWPDLSQAIESGMTKAEYLQVGSARSWLRLRNVPQLPNTTDPNS